LFWQTASFASLNLILLLFAVLLLFGFTGCKEHINYGRFYNNINEKGIILDGYDAVAFFTDKKPVKGSPQFQHQYEEATYQFANQDHLNLFKANPEQYKPQFGAWCAYAVSLGRVAPIDVNTFSIVNGRLVIQHNQRAVRGWNKDVQGNLVKADKYWPDVMKRHGKQITTDEEKDFLNNTNSDGVILEGYDAVGYFTSGKAIKGDPNYSSRYNGATYWFSSEANANLFKDNPAKYAPQYGAYCGYAMTLGKLRPIDPTIFQIYNGRLILQHSQKAYNLFNNNISESVGQADANWPKQVKKHAGKKVGYDKQA
jgi:YHS domain-containing protein